MRSLTSGLVKMLRKAFWSQAKRREHVDETKGARRSAFCGLKKAPDAMLADGAWTRVMRRAEGVGSNGGLVVL